MTTDRKTFLALAALDVAATLLVFNLVGHYRGITDHFVVFPLLVPFAALGFALHLIDGYRARTDMMSLDYTSLHVIAVACAMFGTLLLTFVFAPGGYELQSSRAVIAFSFAVLLPVTLGYRRMVYEAASANRRGRSLVFIGPPSGCVAFRDECRKMGAEEPIIFATPADSGSEAAAAEGIALRPIAEVLSEILEQRLAVEAVVLRESSRGVAPEIAEELVRLHFRGIPTTTLELYHQLRWRKIPIYRLNPSWLFEEGFPIAREPVFERLKRVSDIVFAAVGLALAAPIVALAAAAILVDDRGPIFYAQTRVGKGGVRFGIAKLRTMRRGVGGDLYTWPGDLRITRVGRFLRATRIDELPQLWNVLRGQMSLIGPRAEWDKLAGEYERQIPCYNFRHLVKPGITGWAQVNYLYGSSLEDTVRKLEYDLYYIRHFSFTLDASIILKTIQVMLFGKGR
jgi:exopolysaccharide biosynthesis polyprenyl glycosylphosphotransferase